MAKSDFDTSSLESDRSSNEVRSTSTGNTTDCPPSPSTSRFYQLQNRLAPTFGQAGFGSTASKATPVFGGFGSTFSTARRIFGQRGLGVTASAATPIFGQGGFGSTPSTAGPVFGQGGFGAHFTTTTPDFEVKSRTSDTPSTTSSDSGLGVPPLANASKINIFEFQRGKSHQNPVPPLPMAAPKHVSRQQEAQDHLQLIPGLSVHTPDAQSDAEMEDIKTTPLFTHRVRMAWGNDVGTPGVSIDDFFQHYGLLGIREETYNSQHQNTSEVLSAEENLVYANTNAPWSTFICGSQGAGKSHSLSCLLENSLLRSSPAGVNPNPLAGLVFHFDRFTSYESTQLCEVAYLCSSGIPVRVLASPSNIHAMRRLYRNLPGLPNGSPRPEVIPLYFRESQLNVSRLMTLMAVNGDNGVPLYMEILFKILRDMSTENRGAGGLNYLDFKTRLMGQGFTPMQKAPLGMRLALLESFLAHNQQSGEATARLNQLFDSAQGTLTIVDLSCPFVNEHDACALFTICLSIFMENRGDCARLIALDEAHKFLTQSGEAEKLTAQLISIVRQQRHLGTRIIVATQEPTLAPGLLDLCNVAIVHRFNSPAWFEVLRKHLAGARLCSDHNDTQLFETIVGLSTGEALVFCPSARLDVSDDNEVHRLNDAFIRVRIRGRVTADGGRSILASEQTQNFATEEIPADELIVPFTAGTRPLNTAAHFSQSVRSASFDNVPTSHIRSDSAISRPAVASALSRPADLPPASTSGFGSAAQTRDVNMQRRLKNFVHDAVSESLKADPFVFKWSAVRRQAAHAAGLPQGFFESNKEWTNWSRKTMRDEVATYVRDHGIAQPAFT